MSGSSHIALLHQTATHRMQCISTKGPADFHADVSVGRQVDGTLYRHCQGVGVVLCKWTRNISLTNRQSYRWNPAACGGNLTCVRVALQNSPPQTYENLQKHKNISRTDWRWTTFTNNKLYLWHNLLNSSGFIQRVYKPTILQRSALLLCIKSEHLISESP